MTGLKTALYDVHVELGGKLVPFAGWQMPLHYGSQIEEHRHVRSDAGMFDVSHMTIIDFSGGDVKAYLRSLLANDIEKMTSPGKALYSCMLNEQGGVIDDLIVYYRAPDRYRLVVNAATREKDLAWMRQRAAGMAVELDVRDDLAMIAVQGPNARSTVHRCLPKALVDLAAALKPFFFCESEDTFIARTGYTGEDGYELMLPAADAVYLWRKLQEQGVHATGLGARDTLRLEAGMNLYGTDMDETVSPLESGLAWTVSFKDEERDFTGRKALEAQKASGDLKRFVGLLLEGKGVLRNHQKIFQGEQEVGEITSGTFSPTVGQAVAMARIAVQEGKLETEIRGKRMPVRLVKLPFVRLGKICIDI